MARIVILALFLLLASPPAQAQGTGTDAPAPILPTLETAADARPLSETRSDRVRKIIDQTRVLTQSGRIVELSGIEVPQDFVFESNEIIKLIFKDSSDSDMLMYQTPGAGDGRVNRLGHDLAHIVRRNGRIWVQGALLANGYARALPTPANPELAEKMFALEDDAREHKRGLWADASTHKMLYADQALEPMNRFAVVQGRVAKVATISNVTYLNFGNDWSRDFTIGIPATVRQAMGRKKIDVFALQGKTVRVRGWMRYYNGPYIELELPVLLQQVGDGVTQSQ